MYFVTKSFAIATTWFYTHCNFLLLKSILYEMAEYYFENNKTKRNLKSFLIARSGRPWKKVWPDLTKFCYLTTTFKIFSHFERVQITFGKFLSLLWQILYAIGQIFIVEIRKILKNNPAIWSHWKKQRKNERRDGRKNNHRVVTVTVSVTAKNVATFYFFFFFFCQTLYPVLLQTQSHEKGKGPVYRAL